jgi:multisubunit Na+/H+ antiporter MnhB subunit
LKKILFVSIVLLVLFFTGVASAQTISFATIDATPQDVYMYAANGTMIGSGYNTTSTGIALPNGTDLIFTIKPHTANPLDDPGVFMQSGFNYVKTNVIALIIMIFLIALFFKRGK